MIQFPWSFGVSDDARQKLTVIEARIDDLVTENTNLAAENIELREKLNIARKAITAASDALFEVDTTPLEESR